MSGHSKWSTIKRKKGKADAERGKIFTKLIKEIVVAAREGGGDPDTNPRLRTAIHAARDANMPAANMDKAILRGTGELPGVVYEAATFEGYALGGVAVLVESLTDNRNRTTADVRHIFTKHGGHLGEPGSVSYMFESKGLVVIDQSAAKEDRIYEIALENGAEDIISEDDHFEVICPPEALEGIREGILAAGIEYQVAEVSLHPKITVGLDSDKAVKVLKLVAALEDNDDVQRVTANFDITDEILREIEDQI